MKIGMTTKGLKETKAKLEKFDSDKIVGIMKMGLYDGAGVGKDAYAGAISGIPRSENSWGRTRISRAGVQQYISMYPYLKWLHPDDEGSISGIPDYQVADMVASIEIEKMTETSNGVYNYVNIGGYDGIPTKKYPKGVPLRLVLRAIEHGTSFRNATNTVAHARDSMRASVRNAMKETIINEVNKEFK